jgi:DivIVA domain-containing protein
MRQGVGAAMTGDEVRDVRFFSHASGYNISDEGYDASEVDDLLRRIAAELDAGRPAGPLIANATFRRADWRSDGYRKDAVDLFLEQLAWREDNSALDGARADPWRNLAVGNFYFRSGPNDLAEPTGTPPRRRGIKDSRRNRERLAQECAEEWRDFGQQPGTLLRWVPVGAGRRELRTAEQTIASLPWVISGRATTVRGGGRTFSSKRISGSGPNSREFLDETGTPILYTGGRNYNFNAGAYISFPDPDQQWFRFPVRGTSPANAIMTAIDQAGNRVARYRVIGKPMGNIQLALRGLAGRTIEIIVHPDQPLTNRLMLAMAISAPWLGSYLARPTGP